MYFPDLTPYQYGGAELHSQVLNVGWLSADHDFPRGVPHEGLVDALRRLVASPINLYRGSHLCEFCRYPLKILSEGGIPMLDPPPGTTGNGEIRVVDVMGTTYVVPILILHYVAEHGYLPPKEFVDAVCMIPSGRFDGSHVEGLI